MKLTLILAAFLLGSCATTPDAPRFGPLNGKIARAKVAAGAVAAYWG